LSFRAVVDATEFVAEISLGEDRFLTPMYAMAMYSIAYIAIGTFEMTIAPLEMTVP